MNKEELQLYLETIAKRKAWDDDLRTFDIRRLSENNFEKCYNGGVSAGEISLARELLLKFFSSGDS